MSTLSFITDENLKNHVKRTIEVYGDKLLPFTLKKFNNNIIDPIKIIFDKNIYNYSWEDIIKNEIIRQRDKSNNNEIGYFHQRIFQYMPNCIVPKSGWDIIFSPSEKIILPDGDKVSSVFVELKNKHNTMNSSSSSRIYMRMQHKLLSDNDCACFLVEAVAKKSQNVEWVITNYGKKQSHSRIRRLSIDKFYALVTGEENAFFKLCMNLPDIIQQILNEVGQLKIGKDTVIEELRVIEKQKSSFLLVLYMLGFSTYNGFDE